MDNKKIKKKIKELEYIPVANKMIIAGALFIFAAYYFDHILEYQDIDI